MSTNTSSFSRVTYVILLLSCPLLVQAGNFAGGTGKPNDPYRIATAQQLDAITSTANWPDNHFLLINDIDLDPNLPGGRVFEGAVIASGDAPWHRPFVGNFNGGAHTIRNLVIRAQSQSSWVLTSAGLFGGIDRGAVVRNLKIEAADVEVLDRRAGILVGENAGRVINCQVSGRVSSNFAVFHVDEVGGLVGRNTGDIINCRADTNLVRGDRYAGGLVGYNFSEGIIAGCRAACSQVSAYHHGAGGLVGANSGSIIGSDATGGIVGADSSFMYGGLTGTNTGAILNCHAAGHLVAGVRCSQWGGLAGENRGTIINCYASGSLSMQSQCYLIGGLVGWNLSPGRVANSYAVGTISIGADNKYVGGLVGDDTEGEVKMSFWDTETTGVSVSAAGQGLTTARMQQAATFLEAGWDFVDERANGVTDAWRMPEGGGTPVLTLGFDGYTPRRLAGAGTAETPYQIATPEDLGLLWRHDPTACYQLCSNLDLADLRWVGAPSTAFNGIFDGGGFVISHLTLHERTTAGLFATLSPDAMVMDLGIADANVVGAEGARNLGVLAGRNFHGDILRCYATGRLAAGRRSFALGGLIGHNSGSVTDCYAKTHLSCGEKSSRLGGLSGENSGTIKHSYATGAVVTPDPNETCGGLLGAPEKNAFIGMIVSGYFLAPSDGGGPNNGLGIALTDARMKQQAGFTYWDFKNTWMICEGKDYPRLRWEKITCDQP